MRNKFVYSFNLKIHISGFSELLDSIFCILLAVEAFSLQKVVKVVEQVAVGGWDQVNMADETNLHSPVHSTFEALAVPHVVRCCRGEYFGPFCWPMPAAGAAVFGASHQFAEHTSQMSWFHRDSENCSGSDWQKTTKLHFLVQVWLWKVLWNFSVQPLSWSSLVVVYNPLFVTLHNPIEKWLIVV